MLYNITQKTGTPASSLDKAANRHQRRMQAALAIASSAIDMGALQGAIGPLHLACWEAICAADARGDCDDLFKVLPQINGAIHAIYGVERLLDCLPRACVIPKAPLGAIPRAMLGAIRIPVRTPHEQLLPLAA